MTSKSSPDGSGDQGPKPSRNRDSVDRNSIQTASADALGHGITIAVSIAMFLWVGDRLDRWLGTSPFLALFGMLLGAAAGFYRLYAHMVLAKREADVAHDESSENAS